MAEREVRADHSGIPPVNCIPKIYLNKIIRRKESK